MTDATNALPLADVSEMAMVHGLFRTALGRGSKLVGDVADGDAERAQLVAAYYSNVLRLLHAHRGGEDELMTPRLLQRCPESADLISRIAAQHEPVHADLERVEALLRPWLWLILGLVREHLSGEHRDGFDANVPPPVAQMWADSGRGLYTEFMTEPLTAEDGRPTPRASSVPLP
ncbi:MAG TPA: hemerythrin domain-containing protein [Candidatus Dormibacteraeota bacterium]|nr:hemerythrin domain-containing protein [Candidatus Dormibacteraeota bacterium]